MGVRWWDARRAAALRGEWSVGCLMMSGWRVLACMHVRRGAAQPRRQKMKKSRAHPGTHLQLQQLGGGALRILLQRFEGGRWVSGAEVRLPRVDDLLQPVACQRPLQHHLRKGRAAARVRLWVGCRGGIAWGRLGRSQVWAHKEVCQTVPGQGLACFPLLAQSTPLMLANNPTTSDYRCTAACPDWAIYCRQILPAGQARRAGKDTAGSNDSSLMQVFGLEFKGCSPHNCAGTHARLSQIQINAWHRPAHLVQRLQHRLVGRAALVGGIDRVPPPLQRGRQQWQAVQWATAPPVALSPASCAAKAGSSCQTSLLRRRQAVASCWPAPYSCCAWH